MLNSIHIRCNITKRFHLSQKIVVLQITSLLERGLQLYKGTEFVFSTVCFGTYCACHDFVGGERIKRVFDGVINIALLNNPLIYIIFCTILTVKYRDLYFCALWARLQYINSNAICQPRHHFSCSCFQRGGRAWLWCLHYSCHVYFLHGQEDKYHLNYL